MSTNISTEGCTNCTRSGFSKVYSHKVALGPANYVFQFLGSLVLGSIMNLLCDHSLFVLAVEELKENLIQEMDSGDRDKNLMLLIKMMENERITNFREIANGLLNMLKERRHVEFTVEKIRFLRQVIIAGHQQEGNSCLLVFIVNNLVWLWEL